jgi:hypothetical protein
MKNISTAKELYQAIENIAGKHVKHYKEDLTTHDKNSIERDSKTPFIHISRETGTSLQRFYKLDQYPKKGETIQYMFNAQAKRKQLLDGINTTIEHYLNWGPKTVLFWDGKKLKRITPEQARNEFNQYERATNNAWEEADRKEAAQYETTH